MHSPHAPHIYYFKESKILFAIIEDADDQIEEEECVKLVKESGKKRKKGISIMFPELDT